MDSAQWYFAARGNRYGPFTFEQLQQLAQNEMLGPSDLVWQEDETEARHASDVAGLLSELVPSQSPLRSHRAIWYGSVAILVSAGLLAFYFIGDGFQISGQIADSEMATTATSQSSAQASAIGTTRHPAQTSLSPASEQLDSKPTIDESNGDAVSESEPSEPITPVRIEPTERETQRTDTRVNVPTVKSNPSRQATGASSLDNAPKGVNVLERVDPQKHTLSGQWTKNGHSLLSHPSSKFEPSVIVVPFQPVGEYKLHVVAKNRENWGSLIIGLANDRAQFGAFCSATNKSWLQKLKGAQNNVTTRPVAFFPSSQPVRITCTVRNTGVVIDSDGGAKLEWHGDYNMFGKKPVHHVDIPDRRSLFLAAWGNFEVMELRWIRLE